MDNKTLDKLTKAMNGLISGFQAVEEDVKAQHDIDPESDDINDDPEKLAEINTGVVSEVRTILENLIDEDEYSTEEIAKVLTALSEALQEIDPDVFDGSEDEEEEEDEDDDLDLDEDDDDLDLDEDEDEEEDEDDE
jgi:uncharacterized coiled-coil protein SlyX